MGLATAEDLAAAKQKLVSQAERSVQDAAAMRDYLRLVRELRTDDPEGICEYGTYVLAKGASSLSSTEYWQLHEDVALAAAVCEEHETASTCIARLSAKFPDSVRVQCLKGMLLEAAGGFDEAAELYDSITEKHPANTSARRRQIAIHLSRGDPQAAIEAAHDYLDVFQTDSLVWERLHQIYLDQGHVEQAQFCLEEVLLHNPGSVAAVLRLADVLHKQGGSKLQAARGYYARGIEMSGGENLRALYGVLACEAAIIPMTRGRSKKSEPSVTANPELAAAVHTQLEKLRSGVAQEVQAGIDQVLEEYDNA